jgi:uncharacterized membrane protein
MTRRLADLPIALVTVLLLVLAACAGPPAAPALTDPKDIITKGVTSLADVKSFDFTGTFSGKVAAQQLGTFDLSSVKLSGAVDVVAKSAKFSLDAPDVLGTKIEAILVGNTAYYRLAGALGFMAGGSATTFTKVEVPTGSADPVEVMTDPAKLAADIGAALANLPVQPTKAADEKCGDADCYHVTLALDADQVRQLGGSALASVAPIDGSLAIDLFTRRQDYRPAKIALSVTSAELGTFGFAIELRYDQGVSIQPPPADQIAP